MNVSNVRGYIFDLDGTLIDSMPIWYDVDRVFLAEHGVTPPDDVSEVVKKMTVEQSSRYFIETFNLEVSQQEVIDRIEEIVAERYRSTIPAKPGVVELLDYLDLRGIPYGIATATYRTLATSCLERLGILRRLAFLETCSEVGRGKEFPDVFYRCSERMGLPPECVAVVEDSLYCLETAREHGYTTFGVYDESNRQDWESVRAVCDATFRSADELLEYLRAGSDSTTTASRV